MSVCYFKRKLQQRRDLGLRNVPSFQEDVIPCQTAATSLAPTDEDKSQQVNQCLVSPKHKCGCCSKEKEN